MRFRSRIGATDTGPGATGAGGDTDSGAACPGVPGRKIGAVNMNQTYDVDGVRWVNKGIRLLLPNFAYRRSDSSGSSTSGGSVGWSVEAKPIKRWQTFLKNYKSMNRRRIQPRQMGPDEYHPYHDGSAYANPAYSDPAAPTRHVLCELIGSGAFSVVRRAVDPVTQESVACKVIKLADGCDDIRVDGTTTMEEADNEVRMLRQVGRHPSVTRLLDAYEMDGNVHIITDMLRGGELLTALHERGSLAEEDARRIFVRLMGAIKHIHAMGVVHRDIKLENLVIEDPDDITSVKLVDFGLAADSFSDPMDKACGTLQCVAPEVIGAAKGGGRYCPKCDVWGAGVVLFQILSGFPPFESDCAHHVTRLIRKGKPNFNDPNWDMVSDSAVHLVKGLLEVDPRARLSPDQALRHPWVTAA